MPDRQLLLFDRAEGYVHDYLPVARATVDALGRRSGRFRTLATDDCAALTPARLRATSALLFTASGNLPLTSAQWDALRAFVRDGGGFIGVHNATVIPAIRDGFIAMLGGRFNGHPWTGTVRVHVEDRAHPATRHLAPTFTVTEEVYTFTRWQRARTRVLIRLDPASVDLERGTREDDDYALCWCHRYGAGRVFYTAFGHFAPLWATGWFQEHLLNGILWTMRLVA
jgi:type 1 glutamine amidotransferase